MAWPLSQDFNEAIQNPSSAFADADLKGGRIVLSPMGVPLPRSGNYADVYQITGPDGRSWAVKCFTRAIAADLKDRYAAIAKHLNDANLPFTVNFAFLADGIRVKGKTYPVVKMPWVEGLAINTFVKDSLGKATLLEAMLSLWVRLCRRLRETGMAHGDLQHGNVILVPSDGGKLGLKLVDYDGMFVPALAGKPTGEAGHASYQHPERLATNNYSADLDRFPHLVVATALRGLLIGGKSLWDKYDTGDNLLFVAKDFARPAESKVMRELWDSGDPFTQGLLSHLVIACSKPLAQTPWLDALMPEGRPPVLTPSQERQAMQLLGIPVLGVVPEPAKLPQPIPKTISGTTPKLTTAPSDLETEIKKPRGVGLYGAIAAGIVAALGIGVGIVAFGGKTTKNSDSENVAHNPASSGPNEVVPTENPPTENPSTAPAVDPPKPAAVTVGKLKWQSNVTWGTKPAYSRTGEQLLVPTRLRTILVIDTKRGSIVTTFNNPTLPTLPVVVSRPNNAALSLDSTGNFLAWTVAGTTARLASKSNVKMPSGTVTKLQTDRGGRYLLAGTEAKFEVFEIDSKKSLLSGDAVDALLAADGLSVLMRTTTGELRVQPLGGIARTVAPTDAFVPTELLSYHAASNLAAVRGKTGGVRIVHLGTGDVPKTFDETPGVCDFSPDGVRFAIATEQGLEYYTVADWKSTGKPEKYTGVVRIATFLFFSPDGTSICCGSQDQISEFNVPGAVAVALPAVAKLADVKPMTVPPPSITPPKPMVNPPKPAATPPAKPVIIVKERKRVPEAEALKKAEAASREKLKDLFAKTSPTDRKTLAETLLKNGTTADLDDPARYWLLKETIAVATEIHEPSLGDLAIDLLEKDYAIDGVALTTALYDALLNGTKDTAKLKALAEHCVVRAEDLAATSEFDQAVPIAGVGLKAFAAVKQETTQDGKDLKMRHEQLQGQRDAYAPVKAALDTLKLMPDDAAANTIVGRYRCFIQGRWNAGLPMLAKSNDAALKAAAAFDLSTADATPIKKADKWWAYAETLNDAERAGPQTRARFWYGKALTGSVSDDEKTTAVARQTYVNGGIDYRPGLLLETIPTNSRKTARIVATPELTADDFKAQPTASVTFKFTGVLVPTVPGRYKFILESRLAGRVTLVPKPDDRFLIVVNTVPKALVKKEMKIVLPNTPVPIELSATREKIVAGSTANTFVLKWIPPGQTTDEIVPADVLLHKKEAESVLPKK